MTSGIEPRRFYGWDLVVRPEGIYFFSLHPTPQLLPNSQKTDKLIAIYIVRPKKSFWGRSLANRRFTLASRKAQIKELAELSREDPTTDDIERWVEDARGRGVVRVSEPSGFVAAGTTILNMSEEEARSLERDLPNAIAIQDRPINLIQPQRDEATAKDEVTEADLWHLEQINLLPARQQGFGGTGKDVTIAVFDTGIEASHRELRGKVQNAYEFNGPEWSVTAANPSRDRDGHGTHVAGLICGDRVGVAPETNLISGVVMGQPGGGGDLSDLILAIEWAGSQPEIQIVNISAGIVGYWDEMSPYMQKLLDLGVLPVCAVGNEREDTTISPGNCREVLSIGATNRSNRVPGFSSSGTIVVENHQYNVPHLVAPGEKVYSSVVQGGYEDWNGTSMATPIVSGVAALILEKYPDIQVEDLREEILYNCQDLGRHRAHRFGAGLVQVIAELGISK